MYSVGDPAVLSTEFDSFLMHRLFYVKTICFMSKLQGAMLEESFLMQDARVPRKCKTDMLKSFDNRVKASNEFINSGYNF